MIRGAGYPGYRVRYRPGEVRSPRRGRRVRRIQELFLGITQVAYWSGLAVLLLYAAYQSWWIFNKASYFRLQEVEVTGNRVLTDQQIRELAKIELGSHYFRYEPESIRAALMTHPRILDVTVDQVSPKRIEITLLENRPVFVTRLGETYHEVGEDGRILDEILPADRGLPLVLGLPLADSAPGGSPRLHPDLFEQVPEWLRALEGSFLASHDHVDFTNPYRVEVLWRGIRVFIGSPQDVELMARTAIRTLRDARTRKVAIETLDLRFNTLVLRYGSQEATQLTSWNVAEAATPVETEAVSPPAASGPVLTEHPAVLAAASTESPTQTYASGESPTFTDEELEALNRPIYTELVPESKPAFGPGDEEGDIEESPDPAYIYNPPKSGRMATRRRQPEMPLEEKLRELRRRLGRLEEATDGH